MSTSDPTITDRSRRYRQRMRQALTFAHVEISHSVGEAMIELGYLPEYEVADPKRVGDAFMRFWKEHYTRKMR